MDGISRMEYKHPVRMNLELQGVLDHGTSGTYYENIFVIVFIYFDFGRCKTLNS